MRQCTSESGWKRLQYDKNNPAVEADPLVLSFVRVNVSNDMDSPYSVPDESPIDLLQDGFEWKYTETVDFVFSDTINIIGTLDSITLTNNTDSEDEFGFSITYVAHASVIDGNTLRLDIHTEWESTFDGIPESGTNNYGYDGLYSITIPTTFIVSSQSESLQSQINVQFEVRNMMLS